jgi:TonB family protein
MRALFIGIAQLLVLSCSLMAQEEPLLEKHQNELGKWWKNSEIVRKLQLTDAQVGQIDQIFMDHRLELANLNRELKARNTELKNLMLSEPLDEKAVHAQTEIVSAARMALERAFSSMMLDFRKALSKQQWEQLDEMRSSKYYTIEDGITAPKILYQPIPRYTEEAKKKKIEGTVLLQAIVRKDGTVHSIKIMKSLDKGLDAAAIDTIAREWRFEPGKLPNGQPVDVQVTIEVSFRLF